MINFGEKYIYDALNVLEVNETIDKYNNAPAIFFDSMLPSGLTPESKTINYYMYVPQNLASEYEKYSYAIHCRAKTFNEAVIIANAVVNAINRLNYDNELSITCKTLPCQSPADERDNYLVPIEAVLKIKSEF